MEPRRHALSFVVDAAHNGLRIDTFLAARLRNHSPAALQRLAAAGLVTADGLPCAPDRRVFRGERIDLRLAEPPGPFYPPEPVPLDLLYDDPWLLALNKSAGIIAHPVGPVDGGTVANAVQHHLDRQTRLPGLLRPGIVHRLDRETSGVLIVAKDHLAHAALSRQFERSDVEKTYLALVSGRPGNQTGVIDAPIGQRPGSLRMSAAPDALDPRAAATEYRVVANFRSTALVAARPRSGRKHQIRVHLAAIGHPILGDAYYGPAEHAEESETTRHALHAATITFHHPVTGTSLRIAAPPPADFWQTLAATGP
jgi:23S rRNA pseudouridine1911/1915/1917 synthase